MIKKLFSIVVAVVIMGIGTAFAADKPCPTKDTTAPVVKKLYDRQGHFGVGYEQIFNSGLGEISLKYGLSKNITAQIMYGMDVLDNHGPKKYELAGRILVDVLKKEHSAVYTGFGAGYMFNDKDPDSIKFNLPIGVEFSFAGLPEISFGAETGLVFIYQRGIESTDVATVGGNVGGSLGLSVHYWF